MFFYSEKLGKFGIKTLKDLINQSNSPFSDDTEIWANNVRTCFKQSWIDQIENANNVDNERDQITTIYSGNQKCKLTENIKVSDIRKVLNEDKIISYDPNAKYGFVDTTEVSVAPFYLARKMIKISKSFQILFTS